MRWLHNQPGFAALAILTLALGIGSSTTIFVAIQNILLNPFPYTDAERVVAIQIHDTTNSRPGGRTYFQTPEFLDYEAQNHMFEEVIGGTRNDVLYNSGDGNGTVYGRLCYGVPAQLGRGITADDAKPGAPPRLWRCCFDRMQQRCEYAAGPCDGA